MLVASTISSRRGPEGQLPGGDEDVIIVLHDRIQTHDEALALDGIYTRVSRVQFERHEPEPATRPACRIIGDSVRRHPTA